MEYLPQYLFIGINVLGIGLLVKSNEYTINNFIGSLVIYSILIWGRFFEGML